jgi:hypothetical protein
MKSKISLSVLFVVSLLFAQWSSTSPQNYTGWQDTTSITNFKSDSLRYGNPL